MKVSTKINFHRWVRQRIPLFRKYSITYFEKVGLEYKKRNYSWEKYIKSESGSLLKNKKKYLVLVTPWKETPVPFLSIEIAQKLNNEGHITRLALDFSNLSDNAGKRHEVETLKYVCASLPKKIFINEINNADLPTNEIKDINIDRLGEKIVNNQAVIGTKGESQKTRFFLKHQLACKNIKSHLIKIKSLLSSAKGFTLIVPGGVYGVSASYVAVAEMLNIDYICYDSGCDEIILNHGGLGAHQTDISKSYKMLKSYIKNDLRKKRFIHEWSDSELHERRSGRGNITNFQIKKASDTFFYEKIDLLVPLNISWDAAAINREDIFQSTHDRIKFLIDLAVKHGLKLTLRQHPMERIAAQKGEDDYFEIFNNIISKNTNITYISALDEVNTYDLLNKSRIVLPQSSSIGVEAGMLGIPVILGCPNYYDSFPFCVKAHTIEEYEYLIMKTLNHGISPSQEAIESAKVLYYLVQNCNIFRTDFNPESIKWMDERPSDLWGRDELKDIISSITREIPLSFLRAKRELEFI
jgi:hypothetical protein